jgi:hypothetical protein
MAGLCKSLEGLAQQDISRMLASSDVATTVSTEVESLTAAITALLGELEQLSRRLQEWRELERRSRRARFEEGVANCRWVRVGNWPEPVVQHVVFVVLDEAKEIAAINGRPLGGAPTAEKLLAAVAAELQALERDRREPKEFIKELWEAYGEAGGKPGRGVGVYDLLRSLWWIKQTKRFQHDPRADTFRPYPIALFRGNLTHYLASGAPPFALGGASYQLEVTAGSFAQDGLFMFFPQTERLGTCGRLTFQALQAGDDHAR